MAELNFPVAPSHGEVFPDPPLQNVPQWRWDGARWNLVRVGGDGDFLPLTGGTLTGPLTLDGPASQPLEPVTLSQLLDASTGRNLLHNVMFNITQHGNGPFTDYGYTADRWMLGPNIDANSVSIQHLATADRVAIGDAAVNFALQDIFTGSAAAGAYSAITQRLEWTAGLGGREVTVSFWARAISGAPRLGVGYQAVALVSPTSGHLGIIGPLTPTWTRYKVTGAVAAAGDTPDHYELDFWLSDAGAMAAMSGGIGVQSGTVQIWGVQLELGPIATPLDKPDLAQELSTCLRFYVAWVPIVLWGYGQAGSACSVALGFPVPMRDPPTLSAVQIISSMNVALTAVALNQNYLAINAYPDATGVFGVSGSVSADADL